MGFESSQWQSITKRRRLLGQALSDQQDEIAAGEAAAIEQLLTAFANGGAALAVPPRSVIDPSAVATATASLRIATAARERPFERLVGQHLDRNPGSSVPAFDRHVGSGLYLLLQPHAVLNAEADLHQQKADVASLVRLITSEGKRLHRNPPQVTGIFARAGAYTVSNRRGDAAVSAATKAILDHNRTIAADARMTRNARDEQSYLRRYPDARRIKTIL